MIHHVLIIEDEPFIAMMIEDVVREAGADSVAIAASEAEAIASAETRRPDLITSDVTLIEGTGPHAVQAIQRQYGAIPVVFITATPDACDLAVEGAVILSKPFEVRAVIRAFNAAS